MSDEATPATTETPTPTTPEQPKTPTIEETLRAEFKAEVTRLEAVIETHAAALRSRGWL